MAANVAELILRIAGQFELAENSSVSRATKLISDAHETGIAITNIRVFHKKTPTPRQGISLIKAPVIALIAANAKIGVTIEADQPIT